MQDYKPSFFKSHRNIILLTLIFTVVFGFRLYYDYNKLKPIMIPVLKKDLKENQIIQKKDVEMKSFYKINLTEDVIKSKDQIIGKYATSDLIASFPISKKQITDKKDKFGYLADLGRDKRVIPLPSDVNSSGINIGDRIEITFSTKEKIVVEEETEIISNIPLVIVRDKIDAKGVSYEIHSQSEKEALQRGNVPKVLMVEVTADEAKAIEDAIAKGNQINVRLLPPSAFEGVSNG